MILSSGIWGVVTLFLNTVVQNEDGQNGPAPQHRTSGNNLFLIAM